jgi:serine/threonine protein kinase
MAPEQMAGKTCGESDFYSLGICAYEMLTGRLPFEAAAHLEFKRRGEFSPVTAEAGVPTGLDAFFKRALDPDPEKRFHAGAEFAAAFSAACCLGRS